MAKRTSLKERRDQDKRGVGIFFNETEPVGRDTPPPTEAATTEAIPKPALAKVTLYIRPDQVLAIESIQLDQRQKTGKKPDKSDLVQEALDLLVEKYRTA